MNLVSSMTGKRACIPRILLLAFVLAGLAAQEASAAQISIQAREMEIDRQNGLVVARGGVRVTDGKVTLTSREMTLNQNTRTATFTGQVRVTRPGEELSADVVIITLDAGNAIQQVTARSKATITTEDFLLSAGEITATFPRETMTASDNVRLFVPPDVLATAERLTYSHKKKVATLEGNPRVQSKDGYIISKKLTLWPQRREAVASGSVRGEFVGTRFTAAEARIDHKAKKARLSGDVRIQTSTQQLRAVSVTLYYGERRMVAEGEVHILASGE